MTDSTLVVLHQVRLASVAGPERLAERTGMTPPELDQVLTECAARGWLRRNEGHLAGWSLTRSGREEHERGLAAQLDAQGCRDEVEATYLDFLALNVEVLAVCTQWQVVERDGAQRPNDHSDEAHDLAVLERLGRVHRRARPLLRRLGMALERFNGYELRLDTALHLTVQGRSEWLTRPTIDSYHTVWFELHEDLLATLGRRRSDERPERRRSAPPPARTPELLEEHR